MAQGKEISKKTDNENKEQRINILVRRKFSWNQARVEKENLKKTHRIGKQVSILNLSLSKNLKKTFSFEIEFLTSRNRLVSYAARERSVA